jgi:antitoxin component YwqK of YwqJK toxin-antitoxin module
VERIDLDGPEVDLDEQQTLLYGGRPFTGEAVEYFPGGHVATLQTFTDGFAGGPTMEWYRDGSLKQEGLVTRGRPTGEWREWYSNGRLRRLDTYNEQGKRVSSSAWDEGGDLIEDRGRRNSIRKDRL